MARTKGLSRVWSPPPHNPTEVAREALKQLALQKLAPTPDNYARVYHDILQVPANQELKLAGELYRSLEALPGQTPSQQALLTRFRQETDKGHWEVLPTIAIDYVTQSRNATSLAEPWGTLLQQLIKQWDVEHWDRGQLHRRASLERVLLAFGNQPAELNRTLSNLVKQWASQSDDSNGDDARSAAPPTPVGADWQLVRRLLQLSFKYGIEPRVQLHPALAEPYQALLTEIAELGDDLDLNNFLTQLRNFFFSLELHNKGEESLAVALRDVLSLLLENIAEFYRPDSYLTDQISALQSLLSDEPLTLDSVGQLEASLKEVIYQQGILKSSLDKAANELRSLLDRFIDRLSLITESADSFQEKLTQHRLQISQANEMSELTHIVAALMDDTTSLQLNLAESRDELTTTRSQMQEAELRITELEAALAAASSRVQEDQLTGAFNRDGLAERLEQEILRAERNGQPLCLALLDLDDFKKLNDNYGHLVGDEALKHLVDTLRREIRPADVLARFGGEEFVLVLPNSAEHETLRTIQKLQQTLARVPLTTGAERLVMTFSAGVARWQPGMLDVELIDRADRAMYLAKLAGKNRVLLADDDSPPTVLDEVSSR
ncbi:GGDEF domain-containing protein [Crenobacter sp. SG2305]|uniref:GGDEF domain-containing protein n=1 Tax=Crenobacter oryzisoli TaxID=3056844 RepID=UPI0025AA7A52|nr:GGDEF domain-containing protein [Crenobacter sp. SG2305]MDN0081449.1 GGDEF domain-containing protein [Crenobacter sp. SG2305]